MADGSFTLLLHGRGQIAARIFFFTDHHHPLRMFDVPLRLKGKIIGEQHR